MNNIKLQNVVVNEVSNTTTLRVKVSGEKRNIKDLILAVITLCKDYWYEDCFGSFNIEFAGTITSFDVAYDEYEKMIESKIHSMYGDDSEYVPYDYEYEDKVIEHFKQSYTLDDASVKVKRIKF